MSLYHLACYGANFIKKASYEQKMRRLLDRLGITPLIFAKTIIKLFAIDSFELIIDRTNWMFGKTDINFLVLSITWNNLAIPIYWIMLNNKGGNSNSDQRIELVKWFTSNFDKTKITCIYADREFPSIDFITWLLAKEQGINFIFRCKSSITASDGSKRVSLSKLHHNLCNIQNKTKVDSHIRRIFGNRLFISARLNNVNEFVILVSNQFHRDPFSLYARRWMIENMFGKFKIKGFNLESPHLTQYNRLASLFTLIAIAYCYSCKIGSIASRIKPIKIKKLKRSNNTIQEVPEFSLFNYGFYLLKSIIISYLCDSAVVARQLYQILNYPPKTNISKHSRIYRIMNNL